MDPRELFKKVQQQEAKKVYTFALEIGYGVVKGAIWTIEAEKAKVFSFSEVIDWGEEEELVLAADKAYSSAVEKAGLSEEDEPKRIIFGLPFSWVEKEKILPEKLKVLKKLCQDLDLKPVGFVVTTEAIVKYLKTLEGIPPNAILVSVTQKRIELNLLRLGKIVGTALIERSDNLGNDIAEGLSRIETKEVLPARIILYDSKGEIEEKKEEVLSYPWLKKETGFNFLHLPKTETFSPDFDIKAVALAGGAEVAKAEGIEVEISLDEKPQEIEAKEEFKTGKEGAEPVESTQETPVPEKPSGLGFGFIEEKDIETEEKEKNEEEEVGEVVQEPVEPAEVASPISPAPPSQPLMPAKKERFEKGLIEKRPKESLFRKIKLPNLKAGVLGFWKGFKKFPLFFSSFKKFSLLAIIGLFLLIVLGGLLAAYWFLPKAEIILFVEPQILEKEFKITLDSTAQSADSTEMIIPSETIEEVFEGEKERPTTGTKTVGEEARGEVVIYNRTPDEKDLPAGMVLIGPGELEFSLDEEVIVASESAGPDYTTVPGKATVSVTALEIGSEGNLAAGTEFEVDKHSETDLIARSDSAFGGGTSREIKVVAETDQEELLASLLGELRVQAASRLKEKISLGKVLVDESLKEEILEKSFNKGVGDETEQLDLVLKAKFKSLAYQDSDFKSLVEEKIRNSISSGFEFKEEESEVSFELDKMIDEDKALFTASFKASLWPKINADQIRNDLRGKKPELGKFYLNGLANIAGYEVIFTSSLPQRLKTFPRVSKNIKIEIRSR